MGLRTLIPPGIRRNVAGRSRQLAKQLGLELLGQVSRGAGFASQWAADTRRTANFIRGMLEFEARPDDIWIATYPRSGTTWSQYLLLLLHYGPELEFDHVQDVSPWFERTLALGSTDAAAINAMPSPRIFKTHLPAAWVPKVGKIIQISRDGRDVAQSYYELYRKYLGYRESFERFFEQFLRGDLQYRSWFDFERGWRERHDEENVLALRYEDMRAKPRAAVERIARFCGVNREASELDAIVEAASIEQMKRIESKFDHAKQLLRERGIEANSFIRSGQVGHGAGALNAEQEAAYQRELARVQESPPRTELRIAAFLE